MQIPAALTPPMRVLASVESTNRSGRSMEPTTLVLDGAARELGTDLDAAITATSEATQGAKVGAAAVLRSADGSFVAQPIRELPTGSPFEVERSRAARPLVTGQMEVHATDVVAIVDGRRIERMPDYARQAPEAWQDQRLLQLVGRDGADRWSFSTQRAQGARVDASHFTEVGSDFDAAVGRATSSVRRDHFREALLLLKDDEGSFWMGGFQGNRALLEGLGGRGGGAPLAAVRPLNPAVQAVVGATQLVDLRSGAAEVG